MQPANRGFVLLVVMLVGIAAAAAAIALTRASQSAKVAGGLTQGGDLAYSIAQAGMARASAYALEIAKRQNDFDLALDPGLATGSGNADCSGLPGNINLRGLNVTDKNLGRPFFDDVTQTTVNGACSPGTCTGGIWMQDQGSYDIYWSYIHFNGGTYFVHFDDNQDDFIDETAMLNLTKEEQKTWQRTTSNNLGPGGDCYEGADNTYHDNPYRDRDRTIFVTVIGVYPNVQEFPTGWSPTDQTNRVTLRKMLSIPRPVPPAGIQAGGSLDCNGGSQCIFCSDDLSVEAEDISLSGGATACACTEVVSDTTTGAGTWATSGGGCSGCCDPGATLQQTTGTDPGNPTVYRAEDDFWYDWTSECNFYLGPNMNAIMNQSSGKAYGLWFWDGNGTRGNTNTDTTTCSSYTGNDLVPPHEMSYSGNTEYAQCWTPIVVCNLDTNNLGSVTAGDCIRFFDGSGDGANTGASPTPAAPGSLAYEWRPNGTAQTVNGGGKASGYAGYSTSGWWPCDASSESGNNCSGIAMTKPDWDNCPQSYGTMSFGWNPALPVTAGTNPQCTNCDGTNTTIRFNPNASLSEIWTREFGASANINAVPVGMYYHYGAQAVGDNGITAGTYSDVSTWAMYTHITDGAPDWQTSQINAAGGGYGSTFILPMAYNSTYGAASASCGSWAFCVRSGGKFEAGVGTGKSGTYFPSIVVEGSAQMDSGSGFELLGSVWVTDDLDVNNGGGSSNSVWYGMIIAGNDINVQSGGKLDWQMQEEFVDLGSTPEPPRITVPIAY
jgi:hypothetical protein